MKNTFNYIRLIKFIALFISIVTVNLSGNTQPLRIFQDPNGISFKGGDFSTDNKLLLFERSTVKIWDTQNGTLISEYQVPQPQSFSIQTAVISPDGELAAVGGFEPNIVVLLDANTGDVIQEFIFGDLFDKPDLSFLDPHNKTAKNLFFSPDGTYLIATIAFEDPMWNLNTGERILTPFGAPLIQMFPDQKKLLASGGSTTNIYSFPDGELLQEFSIENRLPTIVNYGNAIRFVKDTSPDPLEPKFTVFERDVETGEIIREFETFEVGSRSKIFKFSPNGEVLIHVPENAPDQVFIKDGKRGQSLAQLNRQTSKPITATVFSPDSKRIAVVRENEVAIWDVADFTSGIPDAVNLND